MNIPRPSDLGTCVYCPRLCRNACPVAVGTGREAATPTAMATQVWLYLEGRGELKQALAASALCVECGECEAACEVDQPLGQLLGAFRRGLGPQTPPDEARLEGEGAWVAIETDERRWAEALATRLGEPVARLRTGDQLGHEAAAHPAYPAHLARLHGALHGRTAVVSEFRSLAVLEEAGVTTVHLAALLGWQGQGLVHRPCAGPALPGSASPPLALACCGARGALVTAHPALAADLALEAGRRLADEGDPPTALCSPDSTCAARLRSVGWTVDEPVATLLGPSAAVRE